MNEPVSAAGSGGSTPRRDVGMETWMALFDDLWDTDKYSAIRLWDHYVTRVLAKGGVRPRLLKWDYVSRPNTIQGVLL